MTEVLNNTAEKTPDCSNERMERLKNLVRESKTGRENVDFAQNAGVRFIFETGMKSMGCFSPRRNAVVLNATLTDDQLAATMVHETRHVWQEHGQGITYSSNQTPKTLMMTGFAIEADACTTEVRFAHEMRDTHPEIWRAHQSGKYAPISTAFAAAFEKTKDADKGLEAGFKAWFTLPVRDLYARDFVDYMDRLSKGYFGSGCFKDNMSAQALAQKLCIGKDGKNYLTVPAFMETPQALHITAEKKEQLVKLTDDWAKKFNKSTKDLGVEQIAVKRADGTYETAAQKPSALQLKVAAARQR